MEKSITIGELAKQSGMNAVTIRYYEKCGLIAGVMRSDGGHRLYDAILIERLQFIQHAKCAGFSLTDIRKLLTFQDEKHRPNVAVKTFVAQKIEQMDKKILSLHNMKTTLQGLTSLCDGKGQIKDCAILKTLQRGLKTPLEKNHDDISYHE